MNSTNAPGNTRTASTPITRGARRRRWAAAVAGAVAALAVGMSAGSAAAHVAPIAASCEGVRVTLSDYDPAGVNLLEVWIDGSPQASTTFGSGASAVFPFSDPFAGHTYRVRVTAWDDPSGSIGWSFDTSGSVDVCASETTPPTTATTSPPSTVTTEPATTEPATTATTPTTAPAVSAVATPAPSTSGPTTTAVVAQAGATGATPAPSTPAAASGTLPVTGSNLAVVGSLAILLVGAFLVLAARRPA